MNFPLRAGMCVSDGDTQAGANRFGMFERRQAMKLTVQKLWA